MTPKARILLPLPLLAVGAIAATGCGTTNSSANSNKDTTTQAAPTTTPAATSTPAASSPAASGPVKVALSEWKITPSAATVGAGKVTFDVTNSGKLPHEMVVLKTDKAGDKLGKPGASRVSEADSVGEAGDVAPGATKSVTLKLKPGHYVLICNIAGHYMAGMHTDLTVR